MMEILFGAVLTLVAVFLALSARFQRTAYAKQIAEQQAVQREFLTIAGASNTQQREMIAELTAIRNLLEKKN